jgi:predicted sugar kinase
VQRVPDFAAAPQVNPYVVDEVVDRVMLQLQPQIIHKITTEVGKALEMLQPRILDQVQRDVIRPLAEELLRNSGKK